MNKKKKKIEFKYVVLIGVISAFVLIIFLAYTLKTEKKLNTFELIVKDSFVEIQKVVYTPFNGLGNLIGDYTKLKNVLKENKILKANVDKYELIEAENAELKQEINRLKGELNIEHVLSDYDYLNATVISRNATSWYNVLTIDKGSNNGITEKEMTYFNKIQQDYTRMKNVLVELANQSERLHM